MICMLIGGARSLGRSTEQFARVRSVLAIFHVRMIALSIASAAGLVSSANAQFVDNGGQAGSVDTSAFGQAAEFSNVTTTFDGVELQILRLIRDPKDKSKLRLIGQIVNGNPDNRWIQLFVPFPNLTDEMGNEYFVDMWTGVDACRSGPKEKYYWRDDLRYDCPGDGVLTLLAQNLPVTISISFVPSDSGTFDAELASIATTLNASLSFVVATGDLTQMVNVDRDTYLSTYQVVVPQIPVPAP